MYEFGCDGFMVMEVMMVVGMIGLAYWTSDLGTGIFYWSVDNYGSKVILLFGGVIDVF